MDQSRPAPDRAPHATTRTTPGHRGRGTARRVATAAGAVTALVTAFVAGTLVDAGTSTPVPVDRVFLPAAYAAQAGLGTRTCDDLLRSYQERALEVVSPWGWNLPGSGAGWGDELFSADTMPGATAARVTASTDQREATSSTTGTNVQEAGVDEPDLAKTDGARLFHAHSGALVAYDVSGEAPRELSRTPLPGMRSGSHSDVEIVLVGDRVVAFAAADDSDPEGSEGPGTRMAVVDVSDAAAPDVVEVLDVTGALDSVRQHGDQVRVVLTHGLPALDFSSPVGGLGERSALARNRRLVRRTTLADWLPRGGSGGAGTALVPCDRVAVPEDGTAALGTTSVLAFSPDSVEPGRFSTAGVALATRTSTTYVSADRLYVASETAGHAPLLDGPWPGAMVDRPVRPDPDAGRTHLYAFALHGSRTSFVGSGTVDGRVADRWSMDSAGRVLRVALGQSPAGGNFNSVVTLAERDGQLVETGRVDKLGVDEEIKSVRWFDDLAIVVTFRQTDPLYAVDLSDTTAPRLLGELKIPGFSQYLHPVSEDALIGVGQRANPRTGATRGGQVALFDISDLRDPRRVDVVGYPRHSWMNAAGDPRQFTWLPEARTALTVVTDGETGTTAWLTEITVAGGKLRERRTEVEHGSDVTRVRILPVAERRVALVTGDGVRFVDVA